MIDSTREGSIKWDAMSLVGHYVALLGNKAICLGKLPNEEGKIYFSVLDTANEKTLFKLAFTPQENLYTKLDSLYHLAQLDDSQIKNITDNLILELKNMSSVSYSSLKNDTTPL